MYSFTEAYHRYVRYISIDRKLDPTRLLDIFQQLLSPRCTICAHTSNRPAEAVLPGVSPPVAGHNVDCHLA